MTGLSLSQDLISLYFPISYTHCCSITTTPLYEDTGGAHISTNIQTLTLQYVKIHNRGTSGQGLNLLNYIIVIGY